MTYLAAVLAGALAFDTLPGFVPNREVRTPTLIIGAGNGYMTSRETFAAYAAVRPAQTIDYDVVPSYTHMDVLTANRDSAAVPPLRRWLDRIAARAQAAKPR